LIQINFVSSAWCVPNLHTYPDSSKLPTIALQGGNEIGGSLADDRGDGPDFHGKLQFVPFGVGDAHTIRQRARQMAPDEAGERRFAAPAGVPAGDRRVGVQNVAEQLRRSRHDPESVIRRTDNEAGASRGRKRI